LTGVAGQSSKDPYSDTGLFGFTFKRSNNNNLSAEKEVELLSSDVLDRVVRVDEKSLNRCKLDLLTRVEASLETSAQILEDVGRQVSMSGEWKSKRDLEGAIERVNLNEFRGVLSKFEPGNSVKCVVE
jgi:predicted Zn-dependent peptidase